MLEIERMMKIGRVNILLLNLIDCLIIYARDMLTLRECDLLDASELVEEILCNQTFFQQ